MSTAQSTFARMAPTDVQTQAAELPQSKPKSGNVRKENLGSIYKTSPSHINAEIGSQFSKISVQEAEEGQTQSTQSPHYHESDVGADDDQHVISDINSNTMEMKHDSTKSRETIDERERNETNSHEEQHDHGSYWRPLFPIHGPAAAGTRDSPLQDIITGQADPPVNNTNKDSQELNPRLSVMPKVPADGPTMVNGIPEGNPDVNKGKKKATFVSA